MGEAPVDGRRSPLSSPWLWAFLAGIVVLTLMWPLLRSEPEPPPVMGHVPAFELVDQNGTVFDRDDLAGDVWVANFFFTTCTSICPPLMRSVSRLQDRYDREGVEGVHLVSFSVDPETDTPERLHEYALAYGAEPPRWILLTGDPATIRRVVEDGFKTAMGERQSVGGGMYEIAHTGKLVLVDPEGGIRGYYDADDAGLDEVFHRSLHVRDAYR